MQKFNWSTVVGCLIISIGIIIAGYIVGNTIESKIFASGVPSAFDIYNHDQTVYGDFLSENDAANYLQISPETLENFIKTGKLEGTYTKINAEKFDDIQGITVNGFEYIFSKAKLNAAMNRLFESGN